MVGEPQDKVEAWFKAQAEMTDSLLARIPARDALAQEWMSLDKLQPATYTDIRYEHGRVFYKKTLGGENVGKLFFREGWNGTEKLLFDPTPYKAGVTTTIQTIVPSFDGHYVAMGFSAGGAEYSELRILDVDRGTLLPESIYPSYGPIGWTLDGKGFFYDAGKVTDIKSPDIELNRRHGYISSVQRSQRTSTSSATKATRSWELQRRRCPLLSSMNPTLTTSSEMSAPCKARCGSSTSPSRR